MMFLYQLTNAWSQEKDSVVFLKDEPYLCSRLVNTQPLCAQHQKIKPFPLSDIKDIRIQEALIVKDLLYVLLGLEGSYIRYSEKYDPSISRLRLLGPDYKINKHLDASLKDVTKRVVHLAKMYSALTSFTEFYNTYSYGKVIQSFVYEVRQFLKLYIRFLDNMEQNYKFNKGFNLRVFEQDLLTNITAKMTHLYEIVQTIYRMNTERGKISEESVFDNFIQNIRHDLKNTGSIDLLSDSSTHSVVKGGLVLQIVQERMDEYSGDLKSFEFLTHLLNNISRSYIDMLNDWITKGVIDDPNSEFFITTNLAHDFKLNSLNSERYWDSKFVIKKDGLPKQFQDPEIQLKVLLTGKYLNVLKECGVTLDSFTTEKVSSLNNNNLYLILEQAYLFANKLILDLFLRGYDFKQTLMNLQRYYMLNNSANISEFLTMSLHEFKKQSTHASLSRLKRVFGTVFGEKSDLVFQLINLVIEKEPIYNYLLEILKVEAIDAEKALSANNFDSIKNLISETLDVDKEANQESKSTENLRAINYFTIDVILPFPLNLIATRTVMIQYQLIFRHLMNLHYTDKQLDDTWFEINKNKIWKYKNFGTPLPKWITRVRSLHDRMKDFIKNYFGFLVNDIIEFNWKELMIKLDKVQDFEQLSQLIQSFLNTVLKSSILTTEKLIKIYGRLSQIINGYCNFLLSLRKVLILLDYDLFHKYNERLKGQEYDYNKNLERMERLNSYLNEYLDSFSQHLNGFIEGLRYYGELESSDFLVLASRLEHSFPSTNK